ncbi:hypothetical protein [Mucilaginibacter antarcticus]|uniref:Uncharacterized protein n=1 Tax=Mucilaginibacter antarcticus TaxID=1855725 RepID=A0ABW5XUU0_9SPHI
MGKIFVFFLLIFFVFGKASGQSKPDILHSKIANSKRDTNRINLLEDLGLYYRNLPDRQKWIFDSSLVYFNKALILSKELNFRDKEMKAHSLLSGAYFRKMDPQSGRSHGIMVIEYYRQIKDLKQQAIYTDQFASVDIPLILTTQFRRNVTSDSASN